MAGDTGLGDNHDEQDQAEGKSGFQNEDPKTDRFAFSDDDEDEDDREEEEEEDEDESAAPIEAPATSKGGKRKKGHHRHHAKSKRSKKSKKQEKEKDSDAKAAKSAPGQESSAELCAQYNFTDVPLDFGEDDYNLVTNYKVSYFVIL